MDFIPGKKVKLTVNNRIGTLVEGSPAGHPWQKVLFIDAKGKQREDWIAASHLVEATSQEIAAETNRIATLTKPAAPIQTA